MTPVRLAVVGSTTMPDGAAFLAADTLITRAYQQFHNQINTDGGAVISGGADGVDTWARSRAETFGWTVTNGKFIEHRPANPRWKPDGYQARNQLIAQDCTHILRLCRPDSATYGSGWTLDRAADLGRIYRDFVWSADERQFTLTRSGGSA